jgi:hypothetical protein
MASASPSADASGYILCPASHWHPALALDRSSYAAGQTVHMTGTVTNASSTPCTQPSTFRFTVTRPDGTSQVVCGEGGIVPPYSYVSAGASVSQPCSWDPRGATSGQYTASATFTDLQGTYEVAWHTFSIG